LLLITLVKQDWLVQHKESEIYSMHTLTKSLCVPFSDISNPIQARQSRTFVV
jgi:hypothetical protein